MTEEEKKEYEGLKSLLYTVQISQYGKRKMIDIIEKQDTEINKLNNVIDRMTKKLSQVPIFTIKSKSNNYNADDLYTAPMSIEEIKEYFMKDDKNDR